jgi:hypothetical protein
LAIEVPQHKFWRLREQSRSKLNLARTADAGEYAPRNVGKVGRGIFENSISHYRPARKDFEYCVVMIVAFRPTSRKSTGCTQIKSPGMSYVTAGSGE